MIGYSKTNRLTTQKQYGPNFFEVWGINGRWLFYFGSLMTIRLSMPMGIDKNVLHKIRLFYQYFTFLSK